MEELKKSYKKSLPVEVTKKIRPYSKKHDEISPA
jgi:hypothetical protein